MTAAAINLVRHLEGRLARLRPGDWPWINEGSLDKQHPDQSLMTAKDCQDIENYFVAEGCEVVWNRPVGDEQRTGFWLRRPVKG